MPWAFGYANPRAIHWGPGALTQLAHELKDTTIKVNAAHPGWVKTEMGGEGAMMEIEDGAKTSVSLATTDGNGPNGAFLHDGERLPW